MNETAAPYRSPRSPRLSADERREAIVAAAMDEFAAHGLAGASVDAVAHRAGVSQPYVYQLFGTKKDLFIAVIRLGFQRTRLAFEDAARRQRTGTMVGCNTVLAGMAREYLDLLADRTLLLVQLQAYAACSDPEVRDVVRAEFGATHATVERLSSASPDEIHGFFAQGMLLNVGAAVGLSGFPTDWHVADFAPAEGGAS